jgi:predicted metalloprotease with PDZ domain
MPLALLLLLGITAASDTVRYTASFPDPAHHEARIVVGFPAARGDTLEVWISRSSPGRYALHEFAKNVYDVRVTDLDGRPLPVARRDPYRWLVVARGRPVRFAYTLYGDRADGTYAQIDATHAHLNMPATSPGPVGSSGGRSSFASPFPRAVAGEWRPSSSPGPTRWNGPHPIWPTSWTVPPS